MPVARGNRGVVLLLRIPTESRHRLDKRKGPSKMGKNPMNKDIMEIDDDSFESQVLQSDRPVLVDFWAPWCGPCKSIAPAVEKLAESYGSLFRFAKCNVDQNPEIPAKYGIRAIPTLIFYNQGQVVDRVTGALGIAPLEDAIKRILSGAKSPTIKGKSFIE